MDNIEKMISSNTQSKRTSGLVNLLKLQTTCYKLYCLDAELWNSYYFFPTLSENPTYFQYMVSLV